jgi:hypothetical protein
LIYKDRETERERDRERERERERDHHAENMHFTHNHHPTMLILFQTHLCERRMFQQCRVHM